MSDQKQPPSSTREKFVRFLRTPLGLLSVLAVFLIFASASAQPPGEEVPLTEIQTAISEKEVKSALIRDQNQEVQLTLKNGEKIYSNYAFEQGDDLQEALRASGAETKVVPGGPGILGAFFSFLPFLIILGLVFYFVSKSAGGGPGSVLKFSRSKAKLMDGSQPQTTFADVAGADEALEELREVRDFLAQPERYTKLGAKIPRGVLLVGPPGTGKTLLARAVAGEAGVPFYSIAGSDFVEMFVGVGAGRVRDLFEKAKANSPCIVFIDEIDAVGRQRGAGVGGGNDEREQTLNALLVEMDGFSSDQTVIVMAATNRPDVLDPALLRPGRFDRQIIVDRPDIAGRRDILAVHAKGKPIDPAADLESVARATPGFTGADLANLLNEAAILTARAGLTLVSQAQLEEAVERVVAGPERRSRVMGDQEKKIIAYHEAGHALVARALTHADPVHKVTILPRGRALGYTMTLPTDDKFLKSRSELLDELAMLLGGRTAEEVVFHEPTTGASNDIEKATTIARAMVTEYGMSDLLGARRLGDSGGDVFLGRSMAHQRDYSEDLAAQVDLEVRRLLDEAHDEAYAVLVENRDALDAIVSELLEHETLSAAEVAEVFASVEKRPGRGRYVGVPIEGGKRKRLPLERPPVLTPAERAAAEAVGGPSRTSRRAPGRAPGKVATKLPAKSPKPRTRTPRATQPQAATNPG